MYEKMRDRSGAQQRARGLAFPDFHAFDCYREQKAELFSVTKASTLISGQKLLRCLSYFAIALVLIGWPLVHH
jgi:hypothetical protein